MRREGLKGAKEKGHLHKQGAQQLAKRKGKKNCSPTAMGLHLIKALVHCNEASLPSTSNHLIRFCHQSLCLQPWVPGKPWDKNERFLEILDAN